MGISQEDLAEAVCCLSNMRNIRLVSLFYCRKTFIIFFFYGFNTFPIGFRPLKKKKKRRMEFWSLNAQTLIVLFIIQLYHYPVIKALCLCTRSSFSLFHSNSFLWHKLNSFCSNLVYSDNKCCLFFFFPHSFIICYEIKVYILVNSSYVATRSLRNVLDS